MTLRVLFTIDLEAWPRPGQAMTRADIARDIEGVTPSGVFGARYIARTLRDAGLTGVFFVEPFFSRLIDGGEEFLAELVQDLCAQGHEVQLHLHPELLSALPDSPELRPLMPWRRSPYQDIADLDPAGQCQLVKLGAELLIRAGAPRPNAFRAGNFGASFETLSALRACGIRYDSSYNLNYLNRNCRLAFERPLHQPVEHEGVIEVPISHFVYPPDRVRHLQVCACSVAEMGRALAQAEALDRAVAVIVFHSFELLDRGRACRLGAQPVLDPVVLARFQHLIGLMKKRYPTTGFRDRVVDDAIGSSADTSLTGTATLAALRSVQQLRRRIRSRWPLPLGDEPRLD